MTIPFLMSYEPYQPAAGTTTVNAIQDMVLITFNPPIEIDYLIGTSGVYNDVVVIKNTTSNATLEVTIGFNNNLFNINNTVSPYKFTVSAMQQVTLPVQLNTSFLDKRENYGAVESQINFTVKNLSTGTVVLKNV